MSTVKSRYRRTLIAAGLAAAGAAAAPAAQALERDSREAYGERPWHGLAARRYRVRERDGYGAQRHLERGPDGEERPDAPVFAPVAPPHFRPCQAGVSVAHRAPY